MGAAPPQLFIDNAVDKQTEMLYTKDGNRLRLTILYPKGSCEQFTCAFAILRSTSEDVKLISSENVNYPRHLRSRFVVLLALLVRANEAEIKPRP